MEATTKASADRAKSASLESHALDIMPLLLVAQVSEPRHATYGAYLDAEEVMRLLACPDHQQSMSTVLDWLQRYAALQRLRSPVVRRS